MDIRNIKLNSSDLSGLIRQLKEIQALDGKTITVTIEGKESASSGLPSEKNLRSLLAGRRERVLELQERMGLSRDGATLLLLLENAR